MGDKPRIVLILRDGAFICAVSDHPIDVFTLDPTCPEDLVYRLTEGRGLEIGSAQVDGLLDGAPVGHNGDGLERLMSSPVVTRRLQ